MKYTLAIIGMLFTSSVFSQNLKFDKVGSFDCSQSTRGNITVLDGTWIRNKVFLCGYRVQVEYGITIHNPWIGSFDLISGKILAEEAWECQGPFNKITADESTNTVVVSSSEWGQCYNIVFDTNLVDKGHYYDKGYTHNSFFGKIGKSGSFLSIQHKGYIGYDMTPFSEIYQFRVLLMNSKMEQVFLSNYIDSTHILMAMSDDFGNVIAVSNKNNAIYNSDGDDLFDSYQMEIFSVNPDLKSVKRDIIPWKVPTKKFSDKTYKLHIAHVHEIINPDANGTGIVAEICFYDTEYPNRSYGTPYIAYFYMNIDGTINESTIVPIVENDKYAVNSTTVLHLKGMLVLPTFGNVSGKLEFILFDIQSKKIVKSIPLTQFPDLEWANIQNFGDIDNYGLSLLFDPPASTNIYKFYQMLIE